MLDLQYILPGYPIFDRLTEFFHINDGEVSFVLWSYFAIVLSFAYRFVSWRFSLNQRHILLSLVGMFILCSVFGRFAIFLLVVQLLSSFLFLKIAPVRLAKFLANSAAFSVCIYSHYVIYGTRTKLDHTRPIMLQTMRLTYFILKHKPDTSEESLARLLGYLFAAPSVLAGPFLTYDEYIAYVEEDEGRLVLTSDTDKEKFLQTKEQIRSREWMRPFKIAFINSLIHLAVIVNFQNLPDMAQVFPADRFSSASLSTKLWYIITFPTIARNRYYYAWTLSEMSMLAAGFGFSGFNRESGEAEFGNARNINWLQVEFGDSVRTQWANWNIGTVKWLRSSFYLLAAYPWNLLLTFVVSAFWHGIHLSFYACFLGGFFATIVTRLAHQRIRPRFLLSKSHKCFYDILTTCMAILFTNFIGITFKLESFSNVWQFWKACYFAPFISLGIIYQIATSMPAQNNLLSAAKQKKNHAQGMKAHDVASK